MKGGEGRCPGVSCVCSQCVCVCAETLTNDGHNAAQRSVPSEGHSADNGNCTESELQAIWPACASYLRVH